MSQSQDRLSRNTVLHGSKAEPARTGPVVTGLTGWHTPSKQTEIAESQSRPAAFALSSDVNNIESYGAQTIVKENGNIDPRQNPEFLNLVRSNNALVQLILQLEKSSAEKDDVSRELVREIRVCAERRDQDLSRYQSNLAEMLRNMQDIHKTEAKRALRAVQEAIDAMKVQLRDKDDQIARLVEERNVIAQQRAKIVVLANEVEELRAAVEARDRLVHAPVPNVLRVSY